MTRIFLIRHAEAEGNLYRRAHGHFNGQVTVRGRVQIGKLKERFKDEDIDAVYTSDLSRAVDTAAAISEPRGLPRYRKKELREVDMGEWEDVPWGDLEHIEPEMSGHFAKDPALWGVSGGETYAQVLERMLRFVTEIAEKHDGETIAVISHGFAIRTLQSKILGIKSHEIARMPYCDNTAVALLRYDNGGLMIEYHSDNSHLSSENSTFAEQTWWREEKAWSSENLRFSAIDKKRDKALLEHSRSGAGGKRAGSPRRAYMGFAALLADEPVGVFGLEYAARGVAGRAPGDEGGEGVGLLTDVYIKPEYQGNDFAVQIIGCAIAELRKLGKGRVRFEVGRDSPFYACCVKCGFEKAAESEATLTMEKSIRNW